MSRQIRRVLKELRFTGGRFEENKGWLDFDVLPELQAYKKLLIETAKEEWRRAHPGRERLPKGFEEGVHLGFREIREGSCAVPVERIIELEDDALDLQMPDEVDEAAEIIDATLVAAGKDKPFPERLSARVIPFFEEWGKTLRPNEGIVLNGNTGQSPRLDQVVRDRIVNRASQRYEDRLDIVGEVRAAELKAREGGSFSIQLDDGSSVSGAFTDEDEAKITEALHEHRQVRLRIIGVGEFEPRGQLRRILRVESLEPQPVGGMNFDPTARPVWELIEEIGKSIPEEAWDKVPKDLSRNLDHYLYGLPKED